MVKGEKEAGPRPGALGLGPRPPGFGPKALGPWPSPGPGPVVRVRTYVRTYVRNAGTTNVRTCALPANQFVTYASTYVLT